MMAEDIAYDVWGDNDVVISYLEGEYTRLDHGSTVDLPGRTVVLRSSADMAQHSEITIDNYGNIQVCAGAGMIRRYYIFSGAIQPVHPLLATLMPWILLQNLGLSLPWCGIGSQNGPLTHYPKAGVVACTHGTALASECGSCGGTYRDMSGILGNGLHYLNTCKHKLKYSECPVLKTGACHVIGICRGVKDPQLPPYTSFPALGDPYYYVSITRVQEADSYSASSIRKMDIDLGKALLRLFHDKVSPLWNILVNICPIISDVPRELPDARQMQEVRQQATLTNGRIKYLEAHITSLRQQLETARLDRIRAIEDGDKVIAETELIRSQWIRTLQDLSRQYEVSMSTRERALSDRLADADSFIEANRDLLTDYTTLDFQYKQTLTDLTDTRKEAETHRVRSSRLAETLVKVEQQSIRTHAELHSANNALTLKLSDYERTAGVSEATIKALTEEVTKCKQDLDRYRELLGSTTSSDSSEGLMIMIEDLKGEISDLKSRATKAEQDLATQLKNNTDKIQAIKNLLSDQVRLPLMSSVENIKPRIRKNIVSEQP